MDITHEQLTDLLELQAIDSAIDRIDHRLNNLPEQKELDDDESVLLAQRAAFGEAEAAASAARANQSKLDSELETLDLKIKSEEEKLYAGKVTNPRELSGLVAEIESLKRRKTTMEDTDLEAMGEREALDKVAAEAQSEVNRLSTIVDGLVVKRDQAAASLNTERVDRSGERGPWLSKIPADILDVYDAGRASYGGVAIAALNPSGMCEGCNMALPYADVARIRKSAGLVRCPECSRILVVK